MHVSMEERTSGSDVQPVTTDIIFPPMAFVRSALLIVLLAPESRLIDVKMQSLDSSIRSVRSSSSLALMDALHVIPLEDAAGANSAISAGLLQEPKIQLGLHSLAQSVTTEVACSVT